MSDETELEDFIEWLRVLNLPDEDFRRHIRGYFDDTMAMERYIERTTPRSIRYASLPGDPPPPQEYWVEDYIDDGYNVEPVYRPIETGHKGRYKGKRRKH